MRAAGLKSNSPECSFGLKDILYLGYEITQEGITPDLKKVQGIMDLGRSTITTELLLLIGMVQYYRDVCLRRSHTLAPLKEAASVPKGRKTLE